MESNPNKPVSPKKVRFLDEVENMQPKKTQKSKSRTQHAGNATLRKKDTVCEPKYINCWGDVHDKLHMLMPGAKQLHKETTDLLTDYADIENKFEGLHILTADVQKEASIRNRNIDEVIYLNNLIGHLNDVNEDMQYKPCRIKGSIPAAPNRNRNNNTNEEQANSCKNTIKEPGLLEILSNEEYLEII